MTEDFLAARVQASGSEHRRRLVESVEVFPIRVRAATPRVIEGHEGTGHHTPAPPRLPIRRPAVGRCCLRPRLWYRLTHD